MCCNISRLLDYIVFLLYNMYIMGNLDRTEGKSVFRRHYGKIALGAAAMAAIFTLRDGVRLKLPSDVLDRAAPVAPLPKTAPAVPPSKGVAPSVPVPLHRPAVPSPVRPVPSPAVSDSGEKQSLPPEFLQQIATFKDTCQEFLNPDMDFTNPYKIPVFSKMSLLHSVIRKNFYNFKEKDDSLDPESISLETLCGSTTVGLQQRFAEVRKQIAYSDLRFIEKHRSMMDLIQAQDGLFLLDHSAKNSPEFVKELGMAGIKESGPNDLLMGDPQLGLSDDEFKTQTRDSLRDIAAALNDPHLEPVEAKYLLGLLNDHLDNMEAVTEGDYSLEDVLGMSQEEFNALREKGEEVKNSSPMIRLYDEYKTSEQNYRALVAELVVEGDETFAQKRGIALAKRDANLKLHALIQQIPDGMALVEISESWSTSSLEDLYEEMDRLKLTDEDIRLIGN